jgi:hypothetical protein
MRIKRVVYRLLNRNYSLDLYFQFDYFSVNCYPFARKADKGEQKVSDLWFSLFFPFSADYSKNLISAQREFK